MYNATRLRKSFLYLVLFTLLTATLGWTAPHKAKAAGDAFDTLRERYFQELTGGDSYDLNNPDIAGSVQAITNAANSAWSTMIKTNDRTSIWADLPSASRSTYITGSYNRLRSMAQAYATYGSSLYHNADLLADTISALDWLNAHWYNDQGAIPVGKQSNDLNWWDYEIGVPQALNDINVLLYHELSADQITRYTNAIGHYIVDCAYGGMTGAFKQASTGANLVWKCGAEILRGIVSKNSDVITAARAKVQPVLDYTTSGDGFYTDGSFIQHGVTPYNAGYGIYLYSDLTKLVYLLSGSPWGLESAPNYSNLFKWMYDSFVPLIYKGAFTDMVRGREISRNYSDLSMGSAMIPVASLLSEFASPADSVKLKSLVKELMADLYPGQPYHTSSIFFLQKVNTILDDSSVAPLGGLTLSKVFPAMDRIMHQRPDYAYGISMFSNRTANYEMMNNENLKGWYTSYGMTYLYTASDPHPYSNAYWPTVNPNRLPGTTVETANRADDANWGKTSSSNWAGGVSLGNYSAGGMELHDVFSPLKALKSWFMFDHEVVALGSGITDTNASPVETIIDNRQINGDETLTVDGAAKPSTNGWTETMPNVSWAHLGGKNIGYYFPSGQTVTALRESRTGSWNDINKGYSPDPITRDYLTMLVNHGAAPQDSTYSYVVLPNTTSSQVQDYANHPDVTILANNDQVQAVKQNSLNMIGANFWTDDPTTVQVDGKDFLTSDKKASVMTQVSDNGVQVAVSDPTQANRGGNGFLDDSALNYNLVYDKSSNMSFIENGGGFKRASSDTAYVTYKVSSITDFTATVRYGYHSSYDKLPILQRVNVYTSHDGKTFTKLTVKIADPNYVPHDGYGLNEKVDLIPDAAIPAGTNFIKVEYVANADTRGYSPELYHMHIVGGSPDDGYINLEINKGAEYVGSLDPNITVEQLYPTIKLRVHVDGTNGRALQASFYGTPPVTTASLSPTPNAKGWTNQDTTVSLAAQDEAGGSGVASVTYSYSTGGAQTTPLVVVNGATANLTISQEGSTTVSYYATDHAGDQEKAKTIEVKLDKTAPTLTLTGTGSYTVDQNVAIGCQASDALSGLASDPCSAPLVSGPAYQFGLGAHTITAAVYDNAGNGTTVTGSFQVNVTFDSLASLTNQFVQAGGAQGAAGIANSMTVKLANASKAAQKGDSESAHNLIAAYENEVAAQSGKAIATGQADILATLAKALSDAAK